MRQNVLARAITSLIRCGCPGVLPDDKARENHESGHGVGYHPIRNGDGPGSGSGTTYEMHTGFLEAGFFLIGGPSGIQPSILHQNTRTNALYNHIYLDLLPGYADVVDGGFVPSFDYSTSPPPAGEDALLWNKTKGNALIGSTPGCLTGKGKFYQSCKLGRVLLDYSAAQLLPTSMASSWTTSWIYTDPDNEYWRVDITAQTSITVTRLDVDPYLYDLYENEADESRKLLLEGYVLAYALASAETYTKGIDIPAEVINSDPFAYSWNANWTGDTAVMVTHEVTGSNVATTPGFVDAQMSVKSRILRLDITHIKTVSTNTFTAAVVSTEENHWLFENGDDLIWYPAIINDVSLFCPITAVLINEPLETTSTADEVPIHAYYGTAGGHENNKLVVWRHSRTEDDPGRIITDPCPTITQGNWKFCGGQYRLNQKRDESGQRTTNTVTVNGEMVASTSSRGGLVFRWITSNFQATETTKQDNPIQFHSSLDRLECNYVSGVCVEEITKTVGCPFYPTNAVNAEKYHQLGSVSFDFLQGRFDYAHTRTAIIFPFDAAEAMMVAANDGLVSNTGGGYDTTHVVAHTVDGPLYTVIGNIYCDNDWIDNWSDNKVPGSGLTQINDLIETGVFYMYQGSLKFYGRNFTAPVSESDEYLSKVAPPTESDVPALRFLQINPIDSCILGAEQIIQGVGDEWMYVSKGDYVAMEDVPVALESVDRSIVIGAV